MFTRSGVLNIVAPKMPTIIIGRLAIEKMKAFIEYCDKEIGWLGTATLSGNTVFIEDMFLFEQEAHATTCEINEKAVAKWYEDILGTHENGVDIVNTMRVWGHSHVNMGASPSGQDDTQFKELAKNVDDFFIRIIGNKKGEMRLDYYDVTTGIIYNNIEWHETISIDVNAIKEEIKLKVKPKVYTYATTQPATTARQPYYGYDGFDDGYSWYDRNKHNHANSVKLDDVKLDDDKDKDFAIYNWEQIDTAEELMRMYGFTELDVYSIAEAIVPEDVIEYMELENLDNNVLTAEALHLMKITNRYVLNR